MTNSSWLMNKVASKLRSVVPANDLKSLNRLSRGGKRRRFEHYFISRWCLFREIGRRGWNSEWNVSKHISGDVHVIRAGCQGAATWASGFSIEAVGLRAVKVHSAMSLISQTAPFWQRKNLTTSEVLLTIFFAFLSFLDTFPVAWACVRNTLSPLVRFILF